MSDDEKRRDAKRKRPAARRRPSATDNDAPPGRESRTESRAAGPQRTKRNRPRARASARRTGAQGASRPSAGGGAPRATSKAGSRARDTVARRVGGPERGPQGAADGAGPDDGVAPMAGQLREIERKLERLLREQEGIGADPAMRKRAAEVLSDLAGRVGGTVAPPERADVARELLSSDYYFRQWGRLAMRNRSEEVDPFGRDATYESRYVPLFEMLYRRYFRVRTEGLDNVPAQGPALLVCNHSGTVPLDGLMLKMAMRLEHPAARELRWLTEDVVFHMAFVGAFLNRLGAVRACPDNAQRLLAQQALTAVFPEGIKGMGKLFRQRYQLQRFGRGGYVKLALRTRTPIVPVAIVGAEETNPLLFKLTHVSRPLGLPYIPVTPTFPWLGPLGVVPLPARWRIVFGEMIDLHAYGPEAAEDAVLVNRLNETVRSTIQSMLDGALAARGSVFFG